MPFRADGKRWAADAIQPTCKQASTGVLGVALFLSRVGRF